MQSCPLAATGTDVRLLVTLAVLLLGVGFTLMLIVRRRDIGRGAAVIVALAVGVTALAVVDTSRAGAQVACPSATGVAPADLTSTPTRATPTTAPTVTTTTTRATTTTSISTTSTSTSTTTTTVAVPDVAPSISGPTTAAPGVAGTFTIDITNVGQAPTSGVMTFSLLFDVQPANGPITAAPLASTDWAFVGPIPGGLMYQSNPGFSLAAGATSTTTFRATWGPGLGPSGTYTISMTLPTGSGGESNAANNSASHLVAVSTPP